MKQATHTRRGHQVIDLGTGVVEDHKSLNEAKRRSKALQLKGSGALGRGDVRKIERKEADRKKTCEYESFPARTNIRMGTL